MKLALNYFSNINGIDSSYEFNARDHRHIQRSYYHFFKPLLSEKELTLIFPYNYLSFTNAKYCPGHLRLEEDG